MEALHNWLDSLFEEPKSVERPEDFTYEPLPSPEADLREFILTR